MLAAGLLALLLGAPAPIKVAVMPVASVEGVPGKTAEALTEAVGAEVRRRSGAQVITQREVATLLSLEQQKAMLGCQNDACFAEIGGALGVDRVVSGDLSRLGESWLFHLKLLDPAKALVLRHSDRRLRGGTIDDVLDALPAMVAELFPPEAKPLETKPPPAAVAPTPAVTTTPTTTAARPEPEAGRTRPPASTASARPPVGPAVMPPVTPARIELAEEEATPVSDEGEAPQDGADEPLPPATAPMPGRTPARHVRPAFRERSIAVPLRDRRDMKVFRADRGWVLALSPFGGPDALVFFGRGRKLYAQQVVDRRERDTTGFDVAVWDPRVPDGRALISLEGDSASVRCGDRELRLAALPRLRRAGVLRAATYYAPPFVRVPVALARDDEGNFFYVDAAREDRGRRDFRLYAGPTGALARQELEDVGREGDALVLRTARGRLRFREGEGEGGKQVDWLADGGRRMLVWMDPWDHQGLVFGDLGVYGGESLGSPCDAVF